jgi:hypothetical protein
MKGGAGRAITASMGCYSSYVPREGKGHPLGLSPVCLFSGDVGLDFKNI